MMPPTDSRLARACDVAAWMLAATGLLLILVLHLVPALLSGLLIYELVRVLTPWLHIGRIRGRQARLAAVALLVLVIAALFTLAVAGLIAFVRSEAGSVPALLQTLADVIDRWRSTLPPAIVSHLPADLDELQLLAVTWLRGHAGAIQHVGTEAGRGLAHILIGIGVGSLVALHEARVPEALGPLAQALEANAVRLADAFRRVVFGQVRISAINAALTAVYLLAVLPLAGIHLPFAKTMVGVVFVIGLVPIVGNLVSNTIVVVLSLSVSIDAAIASLIFLVAIHKLEYFLNAHIVGAQIHAHAWELLVAMLVMEAAFGVPGLVAAPVCYAYLKGELTDRMLV